MESCKVFLSAFVRSFQLIKGKMKKYHIHKVTYVEPGPNLNDRDSHGHLSRKYVRFYQDQGHGFPSGVLTTKW